MPILISRRRTPSAPSAWNTLVDPTLTGNDTGWNGYTIRTNIAASALADFSGSHIRFTLTAPSANSLTLTDLFIGRKDPSGGVCDFEGSPTRVTFGGSSSVTLAAGTTVVSDEIAFAYDGTSEIILAQKASTTTYRMSGAQTGWATRYKTGGGGSVNEPFFDGTSTGGGTLAYSIDKIEISGTYAAPATSYSNPQGRGDRTGQITVTTTATLGGGSPAIGTLVNGSLTDGLWLVAGQTGREIKFDFGVGTPRLVTEAMWRQNTGNDHGTWKWQGSNDNSTYTDIGGTVLARRMASAGASRRSTPTPPPIAITSSCRSAA